MLLLIYNKFLAKYTIMLEFLTQELSFLLKMLFYFTQICYIKLIAHFKCYLRIFMYNTQEISRSWCLLRKNEKLLILRKDTFR